MNLYNYLIRLTRPIRPYWLNSILIWIELQIERMYVNEIPPSEPKDTRWRRHCEEIRGRSVMMCFVENFDEVRIIGTYVYAHDSRTTFGGMRVHECYTTRVDSYRIVGGRRWLTPPLELFNAMQN